MGKLIELGEGAWYRSQREYHEIGNQFIVVVLTEKQFRRLIAFNVKRVSGEDKKDRGN